MAGDVGRTRRAATALQATTSGVDEPQGVADVPETFDTATIVEGDKTPPSSQPRQRNASEEPPHRQPSVDADAGPDFDSDADSVELDQEEARQRRTFEKLVKRQRIQGYKDKIRLMNEGIQIPEGRIGDEPVVRQGVAEEHLMAAKEPAPNLTLIPSYTGNSVKDHHEWMRTWQRLHAASPSYYQSDANKINVAAMKLTGSVADAWEREERTVDAMERTWRYFCDFLLNFIDDPHNRRITMYKEWKSCFQRSTEEVHAFYQRLETIQAELPELSEDIKRMHFLSSMRPGLRRKIVDLQKDDLPRQDLLKVAASLERNADTHGTEGHVGVRKVMTQGGDGPSTTTRPPPFYKKFKHRSGSSTPRGGGRGYSQPRSDVTVNIKGSAGEQKNPLRYPNQIPIVPRRERLPLSELECYECGQKGHIKPNCPRLRQRVAAALLERSQQSKNSKGPRR